MTSALLVRAASEPVAVSAEQWSVRVEVQTTTVIKDVSNHPLGLDNGGATQPPTEASALRRMGVGYMRGGDHRYSFWSEAPWKQPKRVAIVQGPSAWPANDRDWVMPDGRTFRRDRFSDFDNLLRVAKEANASPIVILPYGAEAHQPSDANTTRPPLDAYIEASAQMIRYANVTHRAGIRYWEIGNEVWNKKEGSVADAAVARDDLRLYAPRLRAVDPSIKLLISGDAKVEWWRTIFQAAEHLDYVSVSDYLWDYENGYDTFRLRTEPYGSEYVAAIRQALSEVAPVSQDRIRLIVTEFNAYDWAEKWPNKNDLGHALCVFQKAGDYLDEPFIHLAVFWACQWRWLPWTEPDDTNVFNAFRRDGTFTATGSALRLWTGQLLDEMLAVNTSDPLVRAYACRNRDGTRLRVFFLNKDYRPAQTTLALTGRQSAWRVASLHRFTGSSLTDPAPRWTADDAPPSSPTQPFTLPPTSISVVEFTAAHGLSPSPQK